MARPVVNVRWGRAARPPLDTLTVGRGSAFEFEIVGAPEGLQELQFHVGEPENENRFTAVAGRAAPDNRGIVYANGLHFPHAGNARYHLTGKDEQDNSVWLGTGRLDIRESVLHVAAEDVPIVPEDCYIRNTETGLWHRLTATIDDGEIVLDYDRKGVVR